MAQFGHRPPDADKDPARPKQPQPGALFFGEDEHTAATPVAAGPAATPTTPPDHSALMPWLDIDLQHAGPQMPTSLDPNAPKRSPLPAAPPLAKDDDLAARAGRQQAEQLLTTGDLRTPQTAAQAMDVLLNVPEGARGQALDQLSDKAFETLTQQIPPEKREEFAQLLGGMANPKRKLKLWAEAHKSRARNDVGRDKGDIGHDDDKTEDKLEQLRIDAVRGPKDPTEEEAETPYEDESDEAPKVKHPKRTQDQKKNLARHKQRVASIVSDTGEVDADQAKLLARGKDLTIEDVDALLERKDLEYSIERKHNVNLTAEKREMSGTTYAGGTWAKQDLEQLKVTLERLPDEHVHGEGRFQTINRLATPTEGLDLTRGGQFAGELNIWDAATWSIRGQGSHEDDRREMVKDEFWVEHGDTVNPLEMVLTHEIGHDVAERNPAAFEAFKQAGGWKAVDADALKADGLDNEAVDHVRHTPQTSTNPPAEESSSKYYTRNVHDKNHEFWSQDKTAIPKALPDADIDTNQRDMKGAESVSDGHGRETWAYGKSNPEEHFAEVYAKAVQAPQELHADLVRLPEQAVKSAHATLDAKEQALARLGSKASKATKAALEAEIEAAKAQVAYAEKAKEQRGEQFRIMREDVFHTDKAAAEARGRLAFLNVDPKRLAAFEEQAKIASTPEQIAALEEDARR